MIYCKAQNEPEPGYGTGTLYMEIDEEKDMVSRQVELFEFAAFRGHWSGKSLEGRICDQKASSLVIHDLQNISKSEFEDAWSKAG